MKNVNQILTLSVSFILASCNMQQASSTAAKSSDGTVSEWIGTESGAFCLEDFIDDLDPTGSAGYQCKANTAVYPKGFTCNPTKLSSALYLEERMKGQELLNATYGWYLYNSQGSTKERVQWSDAQYSGYTGLTLSVSDYPKMDFKICTNRWQ